MKLNKIETFKFLRKYMTGLATSTTAVSRLKTIRKVINIEKVCQKLGKDPNITCKDTYIQFLFMHMLFFIIIIEYV